MAVKQVEVAGIGMVNIYKRRDARSIKISLTRGHEVRVTIPYWLPYRAGIEYARSKTDWIKRNSQPISELKDDMQIGKSHRLHFVPDDSLASKVTPTEIVVKYNAVQSILVESVQAKARQACLRALKAEAEVLLPQRLNQLAKKHGFDYGSVRIKNLRSRWGSCSHQKDISLSLFLMQLPWPLIDYVLLHELTHTKHLDHSQSFWQELESCLPASRQLRKHLKQYQPTI